MATTKISVYNLADLKNTSDDAIPNYLNSLKFSQSHTLTDVRLSLGYAAFGLAALTFGWDYHYGFESTKLYTGIAVFLYMCLNGALTYWSWAVEKGKIYVGTSRDGEKIEITTSTTKNVPLYNVTIAFYTAATPSIPTTVKLSRPFSEWFDAAGNFIPLPFQQMFAGAVPIIAIADPTKVVKAIDNDAKAVQASIPASIPVAGSLSASGVKVGDGEVASTSSGKKGKGRKKA